MVIETSSWMPPKLASEKKVGMAVQLVWSASLIPKSINAITPLLELLTEMLLTL